MKSNSLLKRLEALGYPLLEKEKLNANFTLAEVVQSKDARLHEGFPVLLANSVEQGLFNYEAVMKLLKKVKEKKVFKQLLLVSLALYKVLNVKFAWDAELFKKSGLKKTEFDKAYQELKHRRNKLVYDEMSPERLKNAFRNYFKNEEKKLSEVLSLKEDFGLEYALSQVFSPKQKELFFKKLRSEKMTKTEREYYSRAVKKKVEALANPELHRLAQGMKV